MPVALCARGSGLSLTVLNEAPREDDRSVQGSQERVLAALSAEPANVRVLRERCRMNTARLCEVLTRLVPKGLAIQDGGGYRRAA